MSLPSDRQHQYIAACLYRDDLKEKGSAREWCIRAQRRLQEGKRYLKTDYRVHCTEDSSPCKDHCQKFALSDPVQRDFKEEGDHGHHLGCNMCEDLKDVVNDIKQQILKSSASMYSKKYQEDILYDFEKARTDIFLWKSHILRSVNQDKSKQDVIRNINDRSALVVMDWAMKFLQLKYREKKSDWFAKRGIRWHVSTAIFKQDASSDLEVSPNIYTPTCLITASRTGLLSALFLRISSKEYLDIEAFN